MEEIVLGGLTGLNKKIGAGLERKNYGLYVTTTRIIGVKGSLKGILVGAVVGGVIGASIASSAAKGKATSNLAELEQKKDLEIPREVVREINLQEPRGMLLGGKLIINTSSEEHVFVRISESECSQLKGLFEKFHPTGSKFAEGRLTFPVPARPREPVSTASPMDAIKKLGELKEKGILSEEEFQKKKEELLRRV